MLAALVGLRSLVISVGVLSSSVMWPRTLQGQSDTATIVITGTVRDPNSRPLEGVEIRAIGDTIVRLTSPAGHFRITARRLKENFIQLRRPGFNSQLVRIDDNWSGTILLTPGAFELPDVNVSARGAKPAKYASISKYDDFFRRRAVGLGEFVTREEIDRRSPLYTYQIFETRAGIRVAVPFGGDAIVSFVRCREYPPKINVYLDGRKLLPAAASKASRLGPESPTQRQVRDPEIVAMVGEVLSRISPSEIEFVEIFRGPGELPGEFNDGNCGAIAIWSR